MRTCELSKQQHRRGARIRRPAPHSPIPIALERQSCAYAPQWISSPPSAPWIRRRARPRIRRLADRICLVTGAQAGDRLATSSRSSGQPARSPSADSKRSHWRSPGRRRLARRACSHPLNAYSLGRHHCELARAVGYRPRAPGEGYPRRLAAAVNSSRHSRPAPRRTDTHPAHNTCASLIRRARW